MPMASIVRRLRHEKLLSQVVLAKRAGMSPAQLCKLESGCHDVTSATLRRLADALDVSAAVLIGEEKVSQKRRTAKRAKPCVEREMFKPVVRGLLPDEDVAGIAAEVVSYEQAILEKETELEVASGASLQMRYPYELDEPSAELAARDMRQSLGLGREPVADLASVLELCNVRVLEIVRSSAFQSVSFYGAERQTLTVVLNANNTPERNRFRLAYELGAATAFARGDCKTVRDEGEVHRYLKRFAAAFLMPEESVRRDVAQYGIRKDRWTMKLLLMVRRRYRVSAEAFALRLEELGLVQPSLRMKLRDELRAYYAAHPKAMEPDAPHAADGRRMSRLDILKAAQAAGGER